MPKGKLFPVHRSDMEAEAFVDAEYDFSGLGPTGFDAIGQYAIYVGIIA